MKKFTLITLLFIATVGFAQIEYTMSGLPATLVPGETVTVTITYSGDATHVIGTGEPEFSWFNLREVLADGSFVADIGAGTFRFTDVSLPLDGTGMALQSGTYTETYTIPDPLPPLSDPNNFYGLGGYVTSNAGTSFDINSNVAIPPATLSISDFNKSAISVYPNPARNTLNISGDAIFGDAKIYDIAGARVLEINDAGKSIDVSSLNSGFYFIATDRGTSRIIIE